MANRLWSFNAGCPEEDCCGEEEEPFPICTDLNGVPLFLTDANGTHSMVYLSGHNYYVSYQFNPPVSVSAPGGVCVKATPGDMCSVLYKLGCFTSGGVTYAELSLVFVVNNDPCGGPSTHPYQIYQRSDSHPVADTWPAVNAGKIEQVSYPLVNPSVLEFTFPATGTNGPPFHDYYSYPGGGGLVTITT